MKIYLLKHGKALGYLEEPSFNHVQFTYLDTVEKKDYLSGLDKKVNTSENGLFLRFKNMFPENDQIEHIKHVYKIKTNIELLLHLEDIHGSYTFLNEEDFQAYHEHTPTHYDYKDIMDEVLDNAYTFPNILSYTLDIPREKLHPKQTSNSKVMGLSGFQYKFSIIKDDTHRTITIDSTKKSYYFMKPYSLFNSTHMPRERNRLYIPYLLINEHLFMTLARDLGFPVPYNAIIKDGQDYHYIIKRFDRYEKEAFDHTEFATLLGYDSSTKYDATLIEVLTKAKEEKLSQDALEEILLFFFFSTIISHGDLHAKNISLIDASNAMDEKKQYLSPYYDISTTHIYKGLKERDIGLKILSKKSKIKKSDFLEIAEKFSFDTYDFEEKMKGIVNNFIEKFPMYIQALPTQIQDLPFYEGLYSKQKPLKVIWEKYFLARKRYIKEYIDDTWIIEDKTSIFK